MNLTAKETRNGRNCLPRSSRLRQDSKFPLYFKVVNYFLMTYSTKDIIAAADIDNSNFKLLVRQNLVE